MTEIEAAMQVATRIATSVGKKFPKHKVYVRHYQVGQTGAVEIALRPADDDNNSREISTSYADVFFADINKDNIKEKARQVYADFRTALGN